MRTVTREEYLAILHSLRFRLENPTVDDMAAVCPHLAPEEAVRAFVDGGYVACPPVLVRGAFQEVHFSEYWFSPMDGVQNPFLVWSSAGRTVDSYTQGVPEGSFLATQSSCWARTLRRLGISLPMPSYPFAERAIAYAEERWGDALVDDTWVSCMRFYAEDPSDLTDRGYPVTKAVVVCGLDRPLDEVSEATLNQSIVVLTSNRLEAEEIKGEHPGAQRWNCALCAAALGETKCYGCGHTFRDDQFHIVWKTPLPAKVVRLLQRQGLGIKPI